MDIDSDMGKTGENPLPSAQKDSPGDSPTGGQSNSPTGGQKDSSTGGQKDSPTSGQNDSPTGDEPRPSGRGGGWFRNLPRDSEIKPTATDPDQPLPSTENAFPGSGSPAPETEDNDPDNDEYGPPLVSIPVPKAVEGDDTVGWMQVGLRKMFINRYGPRRYGSYFIESDCVEGYTKPADQNVGSEQIRKGWIPAVPGRFERKYMGRYVDRLMAVAWECKIPGKANKHIKYEDPVDYMNPEKKPEHTRYPPTYLYIRWKIEGKYHYSWETRSEMRIRYKDRTDSLIYEAACQQTKNHKDAIDGKIRASKSPSVGLADEAIRKRREQSLEADRAGKSRSGTPSQRATSPGLDKKALREQMEEFHTM